MQFQTLDSSIRWFFILHVFAGTMALGIFLVPMLAKKGGRIHVQAGWVYTIAMLTVGVTASIITPWRAFVDPARSAESISFAFFLFYISIFALAAIWYGLSALKSKQRKEPSRRARHLSPPLATLALGLAAQTIGLKLESVLLMSFPFVGHIISVQQLRYWLRAPTEKMHWWYAHMDGMSVAVISTITAFLVTAIPRVFPDMALKSPVLWIAPGVVLGTIFNRWAASYRKKFER